MKSISATEAKQAFGAALLAAQDAPVLIERQGRGVAVLLSTEQFDRLRGLSWEAFDRTSAAIAVKARSRGLTPAKLAKLLGDVS